jgi:hypothetical protein
MSNKKGNKWKLNTNEECIGNKAKFVVGGVVVE